MGYRIRYGDQKRNGWYWVLLPVMAAGLLLTWDEGWYEAFALYVGAAIRGH